MSFFSDPISLAALVIAALAGFKLWQVLGRKDDVVPERVDNLTPSGSDLELKAVEVPPRVVWEGIAPEDSSLAQGLQSIAALDAEFDTAKFIENARAAHESILSAFATGDIKKLETLLSKSAYDIFAKEIERRKQASELAIFKFIRGLNAQIMSASLQGKEALISVAFTSELVSAIKDAKGNVISGDEKAIARVNEQWIFGRDFGQAQTRWRLLETHDAA